MLFTGFPMRKRRFHVAWILLTCLQLAIAQDDVVTFPTNSTADFPSNGATTYILETPLLPSAPSLDVLALSPQLQRSSTRTLPWTFQGTITMVDPNDLSALTYDRIAYLSCDPSAYPDPAHSPHATLGGLLDRSRRPRAILLYSTRSNHCNYTAYVDTRQYNAIFTMVGQEGARQLLRAVNSSSFEEFGESRIVSESLSRVSNNDNDGRGPTGPRRNPGTSSVAMIILYSVTGVITALFLAVIITGAIRARLHPERYGPRNLPGRPRQSRARGLARAMLETLPIVKFGDLDEPRESAKPDIEMASQDGVREVDTESQERQGTQTTEQSTAEGSGAATASRRSSEGSRPSDHRETSPAEEGSPERGERESIEIGPAQSPTPRSPSFSQKSPEERGLMCSICTEDFLKGQDVRLLPCGHKFHPECIDPWLVNVSGTCPLCRIDLHPADGSGTAGEGDLPPPLQDQAEGETAADVRRGHRRRFSGHRQGSQNAIPLTPEQRAGLASAPHGAQSLQPSTTAAGAIQPIGDTNRRGNRLSERLRDRFRISTRRHGEETTPTPTPATEDPSPAPTPVGDQQR